MEELKKEFSDVISSAEAPPAPAAETVQPPPKPTAPFTFGAPPGSSLPSTGPAAPAAPTSTFTFGSSSTFGLNKKPAADAPAAAPAPTFAFGAASGTSSGTAPPPFAFTPASTSATFAFGGATSSAAAASNGGGFGFTAPASTSGGFGFPTSNGAAGEDGGEEGGEEEKQKYESEVAIDESAGKVLFREKAKMFVYDKKVRQRPTGRSNVTRSFSMCGLGYEGGEAPLSLSDACPLHRPTAAPPQEGGADGTWESKGLGLLTIRQTNDDAKRPFMSLTTEAGRSIFVANIHKTINVSITPGTKSDTATFAIYFSADGTAPVSMQKVMVKLGPGKAAGFVESIKKSTDTLP